MSDIKAIHAEERDKDNAAAANGDNSIPRGDDERIIEAVAGHMAAIMGELKLDLSDPNYRADPGARCQDVPGNVPWLTRGRGADDHHFPK